MIKTIIRNKILRRAKNNEFKFDKVGKSYLNPKELSKVYKAVNVIVANKILQVEN